MADPAGILNGTDVPLLVSDDNISFVEVCGESTSSDAFNNALIEVTNKCSEEFRTFIAGAGTRTLDITLEALHSEDPAYGIVLAAAINRTPIYCRRIIGDWTLNTAGLIPTASLSYGLNESVSNSITINSNGAYTFVKA